MTEKEWSVEIWEAAIFLHEVGCLTDFIQANFVLVMAYFTSSFCLYFLYLSLTLGKASKFVGKANGKVIWILQTAANLKPSFMFWEILNRHTLKLLDEVFVISGIIKVEVSVISGSQRLRLITLTETLIILDITKTDSHNCFIIHCVKENSDKCIITPNTVYFRQAMFLRELDIALGNRMHCMCNLQIIH